MIRVNLLPLKRKKKPKAVPQFMIYMVLVTLFIVIISGYLFFYLNTQLSSLNKQKKNNEARIAELKNRIKEVENYESQKKTLEQRKNIIEQLRRNQSLPVKILNEISSTVPNGVWLISMSVAGESIDIAGVGFTNDDVVNYVNNLKKSQLFTDVYLQGTQKTGTGKIITYQFTLTCKVKA
ncbi:MAG: PilN domain-containing protein [Nitrospirae bacterium]|nr:PilN domain-containing protein [Nitrospirota bacterium]